VRGPVFSALRDVFERAGPTVRQAAFMFASSYPYTLPKVTLFLTKIYSHNFHNTFVIIADKVLCSWRVSAEICLLFHEKANVLVTVGRDRYMYEISSRRLRNGSISERGCRVAIGCSVLDGCPLHPVALHRPPWPVYFNTSPRSEPVSGPGQRSFAVIFCCARRVPKIS
jgi:hypothetical protein